MWRWWWPKIAIRRRWRRAIFIVAWRRRRRAIVTVSWRWATLMRTKAWWAKIRFLGARQNGFYVQSQFLSLSVAHRGPVRPRFYQSRNFLRLRFGQRVRATFQSLDAVPHAVQTTFWAATTRAAASTKLAASRTMALFCVVEKWAAVEHRIVGRRKWLRVDFGPTQPQQQGHERGEGYGRAGSFHRKCFLGTSGFPHPRRFKAKRM